MGIAGLALQIIGTSTLIFDFCKYSPFSPIPKPEDYWAYRIGALVDKLPRPLKKLLGASYYDAASGYERYAYARQRILLGCLIVIDLGLVLQLSAVIMGKAY